MTEHHLPEVKKDSHENRTSPVASQTSSHRSHPYEHPGQPVCDEEVIEYSTRKSKKRGEIKITLADYALNKQELKSLEPFPAYSAYWWLCLSNIVEKKSKKNNNASSDVTNVCVIRSSTRLAADL